MAGFLCVFLLQRDVFALPYIKRELTKYKSEWLEMKLRLGEYLLRGHCFRLFQKSIW